MKGFGVKGTVRTDQTARSACTRSVSSAVLVVMLATCLASTLLPAGAEAFEPPTPYLDTFLAELDQRQPHPVPRGLQPFVGDSVALQLDAEDLISLLTATERDAITMLRSNVVLSRWIVERKIPLYASGDALDEALAAGFSLGLTIPLNHAAYFFFVPDSTESGSFLVHIRVLYDTNYTYQFERDIFDTDLIIHGTATTYADDGGSRTGYLVTLQLYDELEWVRYTDIEGISGMKRGVAGFLQRVFFFVPRTLDGIELREGHLKIQAFVDQTIEDFERIERFRVKR